MEFKEILKQLRNSRGYSQTELGQLLNVAKSTVSMYERGEREPDADMMEKYSSIFGVDYNYLYGFRHNEIKIPVLGYVAAGIPIEAITDILDYEEIDPSMIKDGSEYFALKIKGDSMEPKISNGDVVIVRKQEDCDSGQIAIVCVNGDQATCKKILKQSTGIMLVPFNPAYETVFYSNEDISEIPITILGRVVELRAKF